MDNILCITDVLLDPDVWDICTTDKPSYTLFRTWSDKNNTPIRFKIMKLHPIIKPHKTDSNLVMLIIPNRYYEKK